MEPEDLMTPEVAAAVAVTAVVASPQVRGLLRRGAVYSVAGVLMAGDGIAALTKGIGRGTEAATERIAAGQARGNRKQAPAKRVPVETGDVASKSNGHAAIEAPAASEE